MTNRENLGPAERIIQTLLTYSDHVYHGRPGVVVPDPRSPIGVTWKPVTWKLEGDQRVVYELQKASKKTTLRKLGTLGDGAQTKGGGVTFHGEHVLDGTKQVAEYRMPGLFPEAAAWMYRRIADVWLLDNEFAAKWASYAWAQEHRDLKVVLAAFMLVQSRKGDPIVDGGKVAFHDEDYRAVGEAMVLINANNAKPKKGEAPSEKGLAHSPKHLLRIRELLALPEIAAINRLLGFGVSTRKPFMGRWGKAIEKWLAFREENPKLLDGLVKAGYRQSVMEMARHVGYKPTASTFFKTLRWKQAQADDGRRQLAIGEAVAAAESWADKTEREICELITAQKPDWKRIVGMLPAEVGITRAVVVAAVEADCLSSRDLVIITPTLEELGLLAVPAVKDRWEVALKTATDSRAANVAKNVRDTETKEKLVEASDVAAQKAVAEVVKQMRIYFLIDISGSMTASIALAKRYIAKLLPAFPPAQIHICVFNTIGKLVTLKAPSTAAVDAAFLGIAAGGGTSHRAGVLAFAKHPPKDDEDTLMIFVGDQGEHVSFENEVRATGLRPMAFGFVKLPGDPGSAVEETARKLAIPCFELNEKLFEDAYAIPRTLRALVAATPVNNPIATAVRTPRRTLIDEILDTKLLTKPVWA